MPLSSISGRALAAHSPIRTTFAKNPARPDPPPLHEGSNSFCHRQICFYHHQTLCSCLGQKLQLGDFLMNTTFKGQEQVKLLMGFGPGSALSGLSEQKRGPGFSGAARRACCPWASPARTWPRPTAFPGRSRTPWRRTPTRRPKPKDIPGEIFLIQHITYNIYTIKTYCSIYIYIYM